ncbi:hypothetical protein CYMTET_30837 [Cymbomonas tetramitiformis]|uniref:Secreted protein n=1 Tax=Cymbomonas tetramitiformis TaxID=36881 RepID=A0AAE0KTH9_9CHLO|nr:hypothetical protein CYMTET_30837 [Cymbomonas tetramitiformis]
MRAARLVVLVGLTFVAIQLSRFHSHQHQYAVSVTERHGEEQHGHDAHAKTSQNSVFQATPDCPVRGVVHSDIGVGVKDGT